MNIGIEIPKSVRVEELKRALWDLLRCDLSFDEANTVKTEALDSTLRVVDELVQRAKAASEKMEI